MEEILSMKQVCKATSLSHMTIRRFIRDGSFPEPFTINGTRRKGWYKTTIKEWIKNQDNQEIITKDSDDQEEWNERFEEEKWEYDNRDYADCNMRIKLTIDVEALPELKKLLYSEEGKNACAFRVFNKGHSTELNNILENYSECVVPQSFSVIHLEDSQFEKFNY